MYLYYTLSHFAEHFTNVQLLFQISRKLVIGKISDFSANNKHRFYIYLSDPNNLFSFSPSALFSSIFIVLGDWPLTLPRHQLSSGFSCFLSTRTLHSAVCINASPNDTYSLSYKIF